MATAPQQHEGGWDDLKQRMQTRWPALTEADLDLTKGDHEQLLGMLQERLGYAAENAKRDLEQVVNGHVIAPHDVADEETHTGTSGPVGAASGANPAPPRPPIRGAAAEETHRPDHDSGPRPHDRPRVDFESMQQQSMGWMPPIPVVGAVLGFGALMIGYMVMRRRRATKKRQIAQMAAAGSMAAAGALGKAAKRWGQRAADTDWAEVTSKMRDDLSRIRDDAARMRDDLASATR
ncbi:MAG: hypothetical protein WCL53_00565 [Chloroflexota bacterium]